MAKRMMDIALDNEADDDMLITGPADDGDLAVIESTREHQRQLLLNNKGDFKENPTVCVGVINYIDDEEDTGALMREIAAQYALDGMTVQKVIREAGDIVSNAEYK
ncbi:hypothetical protein GCM10023093_17070 [Nemorincola caseinilytica]|uniref:Uncharacterized protein n=1 Tax=Nemorincola caseinilytica TaxID=2054315 RepID=A0ABP8NCY7_9BACT